MSELQHFQPDADNDQVLEGLHRDGAVIIDGLLDSAALSTLRAETDPYMDATNNGSDDFVGRLTTRTGGLIMRSEGCRKLVQNPLILKLCDGFLLKYCERYQLHLTQIIRIRPGQEAQPLHRDRWAWGTHLAHLEPQLNTIWALSEFTTENGATRVSPGSSDWPEGRVPQEAEITQACMEAGSVLVYTGSVFHSGGANNSQDDRVGLNITYALGWLRQEENQYLSTPPELARSLEPELQDLLGYAMGQYALGYYTPPGAPGEAPEMVPPHYALGRRSLSESLGTEEDLAALIDNTARKDRDRP